MRVFNFLMVLAIDWYHILMKRETIPKKIFLLFKKNMPAKF